MHGSTVPLNISGAVCLMVQFFFCFDFWLINLTYLARLFDTRKKFIPNKLFDERRLNGMTGNDLNVSKEID